MQAGMSVPGNICNYACTCSHAILAFWKRTFSTKASLFILPM